MKKFISLMLALMILMSMSSVRSYASNDDDTDDSVEMSNSDSDEDEDEDDTRSSTPPMMKEEMRPKPPVMAGSGTGMGAGKATFKEFTVTKKTDQKMMNPEDKEMLEMKREEMKKSIEENRGEAQENREEFRTVNGEHIKEVKLSLTEAQKVSLQDMHFSHKKSIDALRAQLKSVSSQEARNAIYEEMKALGETHYAELKKILGEDAAKLVDERKAVYEENESLRDENREMKDEYKEVKRSMVEKYRTAFTKKLGASLDKIQAEKLPQILERISTMMEKSQDNPTLLVALVALQELVEEKMEGDDIEADVLDVVNTLLAD